MDQGGHMVMSATKPRGLPPGVKVGGVSAEGSWFRFDPHRVKPDPNNPRKTFPRIPQLAKSIKKMGQQMPGKVTVLDGDPNFDVMLVDGERRLRACRLAGVSFKAFIEEPTLSRTERLKQALGANFHQEPHNHLEIALALDAILEESDLAGGRMSHQELGDIFGKSDCWVSTHLSLLRLAPEVQAKLVPPEEDDDPDGSGKATSKSKAIERIKNKTSRRRTYIPYTVALELVDLPHQIQVELATKILDERMSQIKAKRVVVQEAKNRGLFVPRRTTRGEATGTLANKLETVEETLAPYIEMPFDQLSRLFDTIEPVKICGMKDRLKAIIENAEGLSESLDRIFKELTTARRSKLVGLNGHANGQVTGRKLK